MIKLYEEQVQVLGVPLTLKATMQGENDTVLSIFGVDVDGKLSHLYTYNTQMDGLQPNVKEVNELVLEYARRTGIVLKILVSISDGILWLINGFMGIFSSIFGGGWMAFGLIGIGIVLSILVTLLIVWVYALFIIVPLTAFSYIIRLWLEKLKEGASRKLSRDALEISRKYLGRI